MDHVTPEQLFFGLGTAVLVAVVGMVVIGVWPIFWPWIRHTLSKIWFTVTHPYGWTLHINMSSDDLAEDDEAVIASEEMSVATIPQNSNNAIAITQNERNALLLQGKAEALATMVNAGKIGETEGIKLVFGVSPSSTNPKYQAARSALKSEIAKLESGPVFRQPDGSQTTRDGVVIAPPYVEQN